MNGLHLSLEQVDMIAALAPTGPELLICPPATLIAYLSDRDISIGGQDCHADASGAHTGDVSAEMLADAGAVAVIVGHSERRADHGETNDIVRAKAKAAYRAGLTAIICIGESEDQRNAGQALEQATKQIVGSVPAEATAENTVIAYEPIWAIGTGRVPSDAEIEEIHAHIRGRLAARLGEEAQQMRIIYGGSMKPDNAAGILALPNVDGGLIGGASLKAKDFLSIAAKANSKVKLASVRSA